MKQDLDIPSSPEMSSESSAFLTDIGSAFAETKPAAGDLALDISLIEANAAHVTGKKKGKKKSKNKPASPVLPVYPMAASSFGLPTPFNKRDIALRGVKYRYVVTEKRTGGPVKVPQSMNMRAMLGKVGESYNVPKAQLDCWSHFFESDASMAILSDAFWWVYLQYFKTELTDRPLTINGEVDERFTRMSSHFVSLVRLTRRDHPEHLDSILRRYPGALAQTLFLGFFIAFPMECVEFNRDFKMLLERLCWQWINGMQRTTTTHRKWKVKYHDLTPLDRYPAFIRARVDQVEVKDDALDEDEGLSTTKPAKGGNNFFRRKTRKTKSLSLHRPIRYRESLILKNSQFFSHYMTHGNVGATPATYQRRVFFTRTRIDPKLVAERLAEQIKAREMRLKQELERPDTQAKKDQNTPTKAPINGDESDDDSDGEETKKDSDKKPSRLPRNIKELLNKHKDDSLHIKQLYYEEEKKLNTQLSEENKEIRQNMLISKMEENAVYKRQKGVHEFSNYLTRKNRTWRRNAY